MTRIMGVVNVTPDSFSDGGRFVEADAAVAQGKLLASQGASIVDVGGESTRPGAGRVEDAEERRRVLPIVEALAREGVTVSIDTMRASTARAAVAAGATIVNDVSGGLADEAMLPTVAELGCDVVLQHWRGHSATMDSLARYDDVATEVLTETLVRRDAAVAAGIDPARIVLDPGLGFAKDAEHNWAILRDLSRWQATGHRVLVGASRKRFLAVATDRDVATAAVSAWCAAHGVWAVRTHEVPMQVDAIAVGAHLDPAGPAGSALG